jgi:hypothetical protein
MIPLSACTMPSVCCTTLLATITAGAKPLGIGFFGSADSLIQRDTLVLVKSNYGVLTAN